MSFTAKALILSAALLALPLTGMAQTKPFEPTAKVAGQTLQLNGAGTRFRSVVKVYDMALYTPKKVATPEELLAQTGAKRLSFVALREISTDQLGLAMVKGMQDNAPPQKSGSFATHLGHAGRIFSTVSMLKAGDNFVLDYVPGKGTIFYVNGDQKGDPVTDPSFIDAILRIWVGPKPADALLKDGLLGRQPPKRDTNNLG